MKNKQTTYQGGTNLGALVFIVFLILKLAGIGQVATWSWWWVTSPLWIPIVLVLSIGFIVFIIGLIVALLD